MSDQTFFLASSTRAIAGSENAVHLIEQKERVEQAVVAKDAALALDTAKAFLETIFKTILSDRDSEADLSQDFGPLYRSVKNILRLNRDKDANELIGRLISSIVHNIGELRNNYGAASHGDDGYYQNPIEMPEAEMVARIVDGVAGFIFHKHKAEDDPELAIRIHYQDYPVFNDFLNGQYDSYELNIDKDRPLVMLPSQVLFMLDYEVYREMLLQFKSTEKEDIDDEEIEEPQMVQTSPELETIVRNHEVAVENIEIQPEPKSSEEIIVDNTHFRQNSEMGILNILSALSYSRRIGKKNLRNITFQITQQIEGLKVVDWYNRAPIIAMMQNKVRIELRKARFPSKHIDSLIQNIVQWHIENKQKTKL